MVVSNGIGQFTCLVTRIRWNINSAIVKWLLSASTQTLFCFSFRSFENIGERARKVFILYHGRSTDFFEKHRRAREKGFYFLLRALDGLWREKRVCEQARLLYAVSIFLAEGKAA